MLRDVRSQFGLCILSLVAACQVDLPEQLSPPLSGASDGSSDTPAADDEDRAEREGDTPPGEDATARAASGSPEGQGDAGGTNEPSAESEPTGRSDAGASPPAPEPSQPPTEPSPEDLCTDGEMSGNETDVDCGGNCEPCEEGNGCAAADDCQSSVCEGAQGARTCRAPTCGDGVKNAAESDVDCGGSANNCPTCEVGDACVDHEQCSTNSCVDGTCVNPTCEDGRKNGRAETDVDCGGVCGRCGLGETCDQNSDCQTHRCVGEVCGESLLEVQQAHVNDLCDTRIDLYLRLSNKTTESINAEDIRIRYWFSDESDDAYPGMALDMVYAPGPFSIDIDFHRIEVPAHASANMYADITFGSQELEPGFRSGLVFLGLRTTRFGMFNETNDYSLNQGAEVTMPDLILADFTTNYERTGVYRRIEDEWVLVSGTEPHAGVDLAATAVMCE